MSLLSNWLAKWFSLGDFSDVRRAKPSKRPLGFQALEARRMLAIVPQLIDINPGSGDSKAYQFVDLGGTTLFTADDGVHGYELWKSDGTSAGTVLVADISPGVAGSSPFDLTNVNGTVYFKAHTPSEGYELWKSDGTSSGTVIVGPIRPGVYSSVPRELTNINGTLFFSALSPGVGVSATGYELWKSDGTSSGTVLVRDIYPGTQSSSPYGLVNVSGTAFFRARGASGDRELWKSDGTSAGTVRVFGRVGPSSDYGISPERLTNINGTLFFVGSDRFGGTYSELWKSDGTSGGTVLVRDINSGAGSSDIVQLTNVNNIAYFSANDGVNGTALWKSDGTSLGTVMVSDFNPSTTSSPWIHSITNVNGVVFFRGNDAVGNNELWKSDGTSAGTVKVREIRSGSQGSGFGDIINLNGTAYFSADPTGSNEELWKSDGTSDGTVQVFDLRPGSQGSDPLNLANINGVLYFSATNGTSGRELAVLADINQPPVNNSPGAQTTTEFAPLPISGLSISDPDAGNASVRVDLSAMHGSVTLLTNVSGGLSSGQVTGNGSGSLSINAPLATINATLATAGGLTYRGNFGYTGSDGLLIVTNDLGNTGALGGPKTDTDTINITVNSVFTVNGSTLNIAGSPGNDQLTVLFSSPTNFFANINGVQQSFTIGPITDIMFNGDAGNDTLSYYTSTAKDLVNLRSTSATLISTTAGSAYNFSGTNLEYKYFFGDMTDSAFFFDSAADDQLYELPAFSLMLDSTVSYFNEVIGFGTVGAMATSGTDLLFVYGGSTNDLYFASPTSSFMAIDITLPINTQQQLIGTNFDQVYAFGLGGRDETLFTGSDGNDLFYALDGYSINITGNFVQYLVDFDVVTAQAQLGNDVALFYDSPGNDTLTSFNTTVAAVIMEGPTLDNQVENFDQVFVIATLGGNDTATLVGTDGDDYFSGNAFDAALFRVGDYLIQVYAFEQVNATLSNGNGTDIAELIDGVGNDVINASGNMAEITYAAGNKIKVAAFDIVYAKDRNGGMNTKQVVNPLSYQLIFDPTWV